MFFVNLLMTDFCHISKDPTFQSRLSMIFACFIIEMTSKD